MRTGPFFRPPVRYSAPFLFFFFYTCHIGSWCISAPRHLIEHDDEDHMTLIYASQVPSSLAQISFFPSQCNQIVPYVAWLSFHPTRIIPPGLMFKYTAQVTCALRSRAALLPASILALTQSFSRGLCFISTCTHEALKTTRSTESEEDRDCTASLMSDSPKRPSSSYEQDGPSNRPCSSAVPILAPPKLFEDTRSTRDDLWAGEYAKLPLSTEADDER